MNQNQITSPLELKLRIDWSEMDEFSHVNNVMFFKYIQSARVNYWEKTGIYRKFKEEGIGPMVLSVNCRFIKPLYYPGELTIQTKTVFMQNTSFSFEHKIFNHHHELVAEATDILVMFDFNTNQKHPFPNEIRLMIEEIEGIRFKD